MIKVAVVASTPAVRAGLRALLDENEGVEVVAEAASLSDVQPLLYPDTHVLVIADDSDFGPVFSQTLDLADGLSVLWLVEDEAKFDASQDQLSARAWGILPIDSTAEELLAAISALYQGMVVGSLTFMNRWLSSRPEFLGVEAGGIAKPLVESLTDREIQVLGLLAQGLANKQIASTLTISEHTVKFHVSSIYAKLGAASRTEAVRLGVLQGLITL